MLLRGVTDLHGFGPLQMGQEMLRLLCIFRAGILPHSAEFCTVTSQLLLCRKDS